VGLLETLVLEAGGQQLTVRVPQTSGWGDFKALPLGQLKFPQSGETVVKIHPLDSASWKAINLRTVTLTPK
jgi:hypothetical protein